MTKNTEALIIEFDLDALTIQDMNDLAAAEKSMELAKACTIIAKVATRCSLGKFDDPQTYLKQPLRMYWQISEAFGEAIKADALNQKK